MKRLIKSNLCIIIPTLCLIFAVVVAFVLSIHRWEGREISYDYSVTVDKSAVLFVGYERDGEALKPKDDGAYLVLPVTDEKINDVRIVFKNPLEADCEIKLVYVSKNGGPSVDNSVTTQVKEGSMEYYCAIPYDAYAVLECYIPTEMEMDSVILSNVLSQSPVSMIKLNTSTLIWILIPLFCAYAASICVIIISQRKKRS